MKSTGTFKAGSWNALCDRCGFKFKAEILREEWTGLRTCFGPGSNDCWEERHPQEMVSGVPDRQAPEWVRPESTDVFVTTNQVSQDDL